ncbi:hypothetical protein I350_06149 [Cryptococcus amylolentus CBS 6273]|uniref:(2E,6E)-farnesyl diphosphate synthase n=1 Tax=Cryptococcus amylolentus CBS 6273 TaxID=1296118 RepID=A0A1E3JQZ6_9TREE|nr:hypothetical protein I350_06149 [Cryptococcus amylolentus CBS 6273]
MSSHRDVPDYANFRHHVHNPGWSAAQERIILEPYTYISTNPGKEIRSKLIAAFNLWLDVSPADLEVITKVVRMLHNASLLMDDVEDSSELRRGLPVAHTIYGIPQTINTANYVYFQAFQQLLELGKGRLGKAEDVGNGQSGRGGEKDLVEVVNEELLQLHRGQGMDLFWRDSLTCPTEKEYVDMVLGKAGGLLRLAVKLMMAKSDSKANYVPLVNLISIWFQIRDDYMNLSSTEYENNKGYCEDLTEGKFSFPIVHGIRADPSNRQILNVLQKKTTLPSLKHHVVTYLQHTTHSFTYTRSVLKSLEGQILEEIRELGGNEMLEGVVAALSLGEVEKGGVEEPV